MGTFLQPGEQILWRGRPLRHRVFRRADLVLVPVSLLWCGFVVFWESGVLSDDAPLFFVLWGVPFVIVGLYLVTGRFVVRAVASRRTQYTITSARLIVQGGFSGEQFTTMYLKSLPQPVIKVREDGSGSLAFGDFPAVGDAFSAAFTGRERRWPAWLFTRRGVGWRIWSSEPSLTLVLWDIGDVRRVRDFVAHAQTSGGV